MHKCSVLVVIGAAGAGLLPGPVRADDTADVIARMQAEIEALQTEVQVLRQSDGEAWLTEQRAEEIRGLVQDVLADADTRSSLLQSGMTAGYDGGFVIGSEDGNFSMKINGQLQVRYVYNHRDNPPLLGDENIDGFEIRRAKLKFKGNVFNEKWHYNIVGAFDDFGGDFYLEDAEIIYKCGDGWSARAGQFKAPFLREELISSSRQLAVDRSLVTEQANGRFNQDRSQGIEVSYLADQFRFAAMYGSGFNSDNTTWNVSPADFQVTGRAEFLLAGDWSEFKGYGGAPGSEGGVMIGAAAAYQVVPPYGTPAENQAQIGLTADITVAGDGWNLFSYLVWADLDDTGSGPVDRSPWGVVVQGGYYIADTWQLYARYEYGDLDETDVEDLSTMTIGVNKYFNKNVKWTTDFGYGFNQVSARWAAPGVGWLPDSAGEDGQIVIRTQLQLVF